MCHYCIHAIDTLSGLHDVQASLLYRVSIQCSVTAGYFLVTPEGFPYMCSYKCHWGAFQTLPTSPLSSLLQLLTSHPGQINSLTMHNIDWPIPFTDIDGHNQKWVQGIRRQIVAFASKQMMENCWASQQVEPYEWKLIHPCVQSGVQAVLAGWSCCGSGPIICHIQSKDVFGGKTIQEFFFSRSGHKK